MDSKNIEKHYWLYVLELEHGCFYVGVTSKTPEARFAQHQNEFLAAGWTKLHKPMKILDTRDLGFTTYKNAQIYENNVVRKYIRQHGIDRVRGGDISETGKHVIILGYIYAKEPLFNAFGVIFLMIVILFLTVKIYIT